MQRKIESSKDARRLLLEEYHGVLSTHSLDTPGYPFGSVTPYCLDKHGHPIILISTIAEHTRNINNNQKVSLIVTQSNVDDMHKAGRLTWIGDAVRISVDDQDKTEVEKRYYRFFPESETYHKVHNFHFYRINLVRARFIGGFGRIWWIKNELMVRDNPFFGSSETEIVNHMNQDHVDAMIKYCQTAGVNIPESAEPRMAGIDSEGMHLRLNEKLVRIAFPTPVEEPAAARKALIAMAQQAA